MIILVLLILVSMCFPTSTLGRDAETARWFGHDFVFCFITDDARTSNLVWADTAQTMGFRFTIAANIKRSKDQAPNVLTLEQLHELAEDGFEIASHGYSHGDIGVPSECPAPPRGSLMGYFLCENQDPIEAMTALHVEIERDSITDLCDFAAGSITTLAYPRHRHGKALIDSLISEGFIAARTGGSGDYSINSYGEFDTRARNGWDEGISLFRVPLTISDSSLFGNHSASSPVHWTYEQFYAAAMPLIANARQKGGMFIVYSHHLGDDDDSYGDVNYGSGGMTNLDLAWIVDLVRDNGGVVMPFGDAAAYYRARTSMIGLDGDYVWMPDITSVDPVPGPGVPTLSAWPNPFNPSTQIEGDVSADGELSLDVFDLRGSRVTTLAAGFHHAGLHRWNWDGRNGAGDRVPAGVYLLRLQTTTGSAVSQVMMIK